MAEGKEKKLTSFKKLFRGREDVFPVYWQNDKKGTKGYSPACFNKFKKELCSFPCDQCDNQKLIPLTDIEIKKHFAGTHLIGIYPLLPDGTCLWISVDFDNHDGNKNPLEDARNFIDTCEIYGIPAYIERSKSGNGYHVWIFLAGPVQAWKVRAVVFALLGEAKVISEDAEKGSFDRLFPNQDNLSGKKLGNLIALPFYGKALKDSNSTFLNKDLNPITTESAIIGFLESVELVPESTLDTIIKEWNLAKDEPASNAGYVHPEKLDPAEGLQVIADRCKFIQDCRDNQSAISEPLWYALASNLGRFEGGRDKFHEYSYKHPGYSRKEADAKFDHASIASGPITCAKIREFGFNCGMTCGVESPAGLAKKKAFKGRSAKVLSGPGARKQVTSEETIPEPELDELWKEKLNSLIPYPDATEAICQIKYFVLNDLIECDELKVNRILKEQLKKKFSLSADEIKVILKAWKEEKAQKQAESKALENEEEKSNKAISNPVFEREGRIWKIKVKERFGEKFYEEVPITSFNIKPLESITIEGKETLKVNIKSEGKVFKDVLLTPECWISIKSFAGILPAKETIFTGTANDVQYIRLYMSTFKMPEKKGVKTSGFHDGRFVTEEGALSSHGVSNDTIYFNEVPSNCKLLSIEPATADELSEIKKHIAGFNTPTVTLPILGWTTACFFKIPVSETLEKMGLGNGFPLLDIQGEAGAGKTQSAEAVIMRTWSIQGEPKSIGELTKFTMMKMVDGSNTIPVVLDENKACMQTDYFKNLVSNLIRSTYNKLEGERGRADQTTQVYRYQAPVVIVGETGFTESAALDRIIPVFFSKKDSAPYLRSFKELHKQPLDKLGRTIMEKALRISKEEIKCILEDELGNVDSELSDRPRTNAAIVRFGLRILGDILDMQFDLSKVDEAVKEGIREGDSTHRKSAVDKILEAMCLMAGFQEKFVVFKDTGKEEKAYKYQDHLEGGVDFDIIRDPGLPILKLHISNAYSTFKKWAKLYNFEGDLLPQNTFSKQLKKESYCLSIGTVKIGGKSVWGVTIDINKMRNKGLELSEFWGVDPDEAPF
jgi:hypothetical protein